MSTMINNTKISAGNFLVESWSDASAAWLSGSEDNQSAVPLGYLNQVKTQLEGDLAESTNSLNSRIDNVLHNVDPAALDSLTEIVAAFQGADSSLNEAITNLTTAASDDRAAIRAEFAAADTTLQANLSAAISAVQDDVDANEFQADNDRAAIRSEFAQADSTLQTILSNSISDVQEDVNAKDIINFNDRAAIRDEIIQLNSDLMGEIGTVQGELTQAILDEKNLREAAIATVQSSISTNLVAIEANSTSINANADAILNLSSSISQEISDRENAIGAEQAARQDLEDLMKRGGFDVTGLASNIPSMGWRSDEAEFNSDTVFARYRMGVDKYVELRRGDGDQLQIVQVDEQGAVPEHKLLMQFLTTFANVEIGP